MVDFFMINKSVRETFPSKQERESAIEKRNSMFLYNLLLCCESCSGA